MMWVDFWPDQDFSVSFQVEVDHRLGLHEDFEDSNPILYSFQNNISLKNLNYMAPLEVPPNNWDFKYRLMV